MDDHDKIVEQQSAKKSAKVTPNPTSNQTVGKITRKLAYLLVVLIISLASGVGGAALYNWRRPTTATQQKEIVSKNDTLVASIAKNVGPSVVSITTKQTQRSIFGDVSVAEGAGTGIILSKDGLVLTNKHVVPSGISSVSVVLSDGSKKSASVLTRDPISDVAFVKVKGVNNLSPATLGDSSKMRVGDSVVAIGNALGQFQNTVTTGIISGIGRPVTAQDSNGSNAENLQDLFQTDAAINPGNSGGPLVNINGQVIGINTAVAGGAQNIGFAIPINDIKASITSVEKNGKVVRPYLGVKYIPLTPDIAKQLGTNLTQGAYVGDGSKQQAVISGSPADKAGIKNGDVITKVGGQAIDAQHSLESLISQHKVGDSVSLTVVRGGKTLELKAKLQAAPANLGQ